MAYTEEDWEKIQDENINGSEDLDDGCDWYRKIEKPDTEALDERIKDNG